MDSRTSHARMSESGGYLTAPGVREGTADVNGKASAHGVVSAESKAVRSRRP
jgi:hypothetical protein